MTHRDRHAHLRAIRDTLISTALFGGAFYFLHLRSHAGNIGTDDAIVVGILVLGGLAVGYRDRLRALGNVARNAIRRP